MLFTLYDDAIQYTYVDLLVLNWLALFHPHAAGFFIQEARVCNDGFLKFLKQFQP